jgi:hypothetical protein
MKARVVVANDLLSVYDLNRCPAKAITLDWRPVLERNAFVVKEYVRALSTTNTHEILDPDTGEVLGTAEDSPGEMTQLARRFMSKWLLPARVAVREKPDDSLVFSICCGAYFFRSRVEVLDAHDNLIGYFKKKFRSIRVDDEPADLMVLDIFDREDVHFAEIFGRLFGLDYHFVTPDGQAELGFVAKALIPPAEVPELVARDAYALEVSPELAEEPFAKMLLLAATLAIDIIYWDESGRTRRSGGTPC